MAGANWEAYNLPSIWTMLQKENACRGADRVLSWDGLAHDVRTQHRRLEEATQALAAVWPPEKNASARIFLKYMGQLATSMQETLRRAEDTRAGLNGILEALSEAQAAVRPWVEVRQIASDDFIPRWADHAEDDYDEKARQAMRNAEAAIADHSTQIRSPALFDPSRMVGDKHEDLAVGGGATRGTSAGSSVASSGTVDLGGFGATPVPVQVPHNPPPIPGANTGSGVDGSGPGTSVSQTAGPALAGVLPVAPAPVVTPGVGVSPPPTAGVGAVIGGTGLFGLAPAVGTGGGTIPVGGPLTPIVGRGASGGRQAVSVPSALPSGTVIGANSAGARTGQAGRSSASGRSHVAQTMPANRHRRDENDNVSIEGKAAQVWDVLHGVEPVIEPDVRPVRHDPGPGVIGLDR